MILIQYIMGCCLVDLVMLFPCDSVWPTPGVDWVALDTVWGDRDSLGPLWPCFFHLYVD